MREIVKLFSFLGFIVFSLWLTFSDASSTSSWWGSWWWGWYWYSSTTTTTSSANCSVVTWTNYYSGTWKIVVNPWETKVISFPQELQEIYFSKTTDFIIMTLDGGDWQVVWWDVKNFQPLRGYWIYNAKWDPLVITYKVKPNVSGTDRMIQRKLYAWWNLIGISQPWVDKYYYKTKALWNLSFGQIIDFTNTKFWTIKDESFNPNFTVKSYTDWFYLWEWLGYAVFLSNNSWLGGVQDVTTSTGAIVYSYTKTVCNGWETTEEETDNTTNSQTCIRVINNYGIRYIVLNNWNNEYYYPGKKDAKLLSVVFETTWDHKRTSGFSGLALTKIWFKLSNISDDEFSGEFLKNIRLVYSWDTIWTGILDLTGKTIIFSGLNYVFETTWNDIQLDLYADIDENALNENWKEEIYGFWVLYLKSNPIYTTFKENWKVVFGEVISSGWSCSSEQEGDIGELLDSLLWDWYNWFIHIGYPILTFIKNYSESKDVIWWQSWVVLSKLYLKWKYDDVLITGLYFANFDWNNISPNLTEDVISNVKIIDGSWNVYWDCEVWWWKIACLNLSWLIIPTNGEKTIKLVADFAPITDVSQTNKVFDIYLTDVIAKWKESWITLKKLWGYNINRTYHFDEKIWDSITITYRKAFLYFSGLDLPTTELKEGENVVYRVATKIKGKKVELGRIEFQLKGVIWWENIATPLILSWDDLIKKEQIVVWDDSYEVENKVLSFVWIRYNGKLVDYVNKDMRCDTERCEIRYNFGTWDFILTWDWVIEFVVNIPKLKSNDLIKVNNWYLYYSDFSSKEHTSYSVSYNISSDWFELWFPDWQYLSFDSFWKPKLQISTSQVDQSTGYIIVWSGDVKVAEYLFRAKKWDISISWLKLSFGDDISCILEWYESGCDFSYVKLVKLYDEWGSLLATGILDENYFVNFNSLNFVVPKNQTKKLIVKIDTLNQTGTNLQVSIVDVVAYSNWNLVKFVNWEYVNDILDDWDLEYIIYPVVYEIVKPKPANVYVTLDSDTPDESIIPGNSNVKYEVARFKFRAVDDDALIQKLALVNVARSFTGNVVTSANTGDIYTGADSVVSKVYVYDTNGNELGSAALVDGVAYFTFTNSIELPRDQDVVLIVKVQPNAINDTWVDNKYIRFAMLKPGEFINGKETEIVSSNWTKVKWNYAHLINAVSNSQFVRKTIVILSEIPQTDTTLDAGMNDLYSFKVSVDQAGDVKVKEFRFDVFVTDSTSDDSTGFNLNNFEVLVNDINLTDNNDVVVEFATGTCETVTGGDFVSNLNLGVTASIQAYCLRVILTGNYVNGYEITAGSDATFKVRANAVNVATNDSVITRLNEVADDPAVMDTYVNVANGSVSIIWSDDTADIVDVNTINWFNDSLIRWLPLSSWILTK